MLRRRCVFDFLILHFLPARDTSTAVATGTVEHFMAEAVSRQAQRRASAAAEAGALAEAHAQLQGEHAALVADHDRMQAALDRAAAELAREQANIDDAMAFLADKADGAERVTAVLEADLAHERGLRRVAEAEADTLVDAMGRVEARAMAERDRRAAAERAMSAMAAAVDAYEEAEAERLDLAVRVLEDSRVTADGTARLDAFEAEVSPMCSVALGT